MRTNILICLLLITSSTGVRISRDKKEPLLEEGHGDTDIDADGSNANAASGAVNGTDGHSGSKSHGRPTSDYVGRTKALVQMKEPATYGISGKAIIGNSDGCAGGVPTDGQKQQWNPIVDKTAPKSGSLLMYPSRNRHDPLNTDVQWDHLQHCRMIAD